MYLREHPRERRASNDLLKKHPQLNQFSKLYLVQENDQSKDKGKATRLAPNDNSSVPR